jgi:hypothetical protein
MFGFRVAVCGVWRDHFVIDMYDGSVLTRLHRHTVLFFFCFWFDVDSFGGVHIIFKGINMYDVYSKYSMSSKYLLQP